MSTISFEWKFYTILEPKEYNFNWNQWISYRCKILVWEELLQFKLTKEQNDQIKNIAQFTVMTITWFLKWWEKWGNYFNVSTIEQKKVRTS